MIVMKRRLEESMFGLGVQVVVLVTQGSVCGMVVVIVEERGPADATFGRIHEFEVVVRKADAVLAEAMLAPSVQMKPFVSFEGVLPRSVCCG
jgi:hypothetical protein